MTRIAITGAAGRMGRNLVIACAENDDAALTHALESSDSPFIGNDAGAVAGIESQGVDITDTFDAELFDVLIDFTHPRLLPRNTSIYACNISVKW